LQASAQTIALKLRQTTTVRMEWINDMLKMKSAASVRQQIWRMNTGFGVSSIRSKQGVFLKKK
jgi:hypothetical protein